MKTSLEHKRNWFFATAFLAAALLYPVLTAEASEGVSAQSQDAVEQAEQLVGYQTAPEATPMQSGVIKCCKDTNGDGTPDTCVWLPSTGHCGENGGEYHRALCPSEDSHPSRCQFM
ncbi:hypothetical protein [Polyangium sorediatum]|uniref:Uncharacterized protein n=1 Tax=Polyangium sorediatum TaxID=889274 RepID=A0ABT6NW48_9BACT|nr:hypothetical protein [Polyangium sorediatum]MDI1432526.1 hypothetical protein [Polyangium sorediatum]